MPAKGSQRLAATISPVPVSRITLIEAQLNDGFIGA